MRRGGGSIRVRLAVAVAAITAVVLAALALLVALEVRSAALDSAGRLADGDLKPYAVDLVKNADEPPDPPATGVLVLIVSPTGAVARDSMPADLAAAAGRVSGTADVDVPAGRFRVVERTARNARGVWRLWAARDITAADAVLQGVVVSVVVAVPLVVLVTAAGAWLVGTAALRPVQRMRATAERLRAPGSTGTLPVRGGAELADLAGTLNTLIEGLRASVAHERRVTADAAHELRTPLAVLAAQVELAERHPESADLRGIRDSVARLTRLTDDLLALSLADASPSGAVAATPLGELVTEAMGSVDRFRLLAPDGVLVDLELVGSLDESDTVGLDAVAFGRVLANLIGNALAAGPASSVIVRLGCSDGTLALEVRDDGPGLPDAFLPYAFDRFARAEEARSSGASGAGLGLALVKRLAERAGGDVALRNVEPRGALAVVRVPLMGARPPERRR